MPAKTKTALNVDKNRRDQSGKTGIWVRARLHSRWVVVDVAELDDPSLCKWIKANPESRHVAALLGRDLAPAS